jgi:hypothetical protein
MSLKAAVGAGNLVTCHPVSATGLFGAVAFTFDKNAKMDYKGHPSKQSVVITLDNKNDLEAYNTFLVSYLNAVEVAESKQEYVDATYDTLISGYSAATKLGFIWYGAKDPDGKTKVLIGMGILSGDTGDASYDGKAVGSYPVQITAVPATTTLSVPTSLFDASKVTQATAITLATGVHASVIFMPSAA